MTLFSDIKGYFSDSNCFVYVSFEKNSQHFLVSAVSTEIGIYVLFMNYKFSHEDNIIPNR